MEKENKAKEISDLVAGVASFAKVGEPCIDPDTLIRYALGELREVDNRYIRAHTLYCDECAKEVAILWQIWGETTAPSYELGAAWEIPPKSLEELMPGAALGVVETEAQKKVRERINAIKKRIRSKLRLHRPKDQGKTKH